MGAWPNSGTCGTSYQYRDRLGTQNNGLYTQNLGSMGNSFRYFGGPGTPTLAWFGLKRTISVQLRCQKFRLQNRRERLALTPPHQAPKFELDLIVTVYASISTNIRTNIILRYT